MKTMDLHEALAVSPVAGGTFRWRMGTRALEPSAWLQIDDARPSDLATKAELLRDRHDEMVVTCAESRSAATELLELVVDALADEQVPTEQPPDTLHPIDAAGRMVQEDLCLLERAETAWVLTAASVCFPTRWDVREKVGRSLAAIHGPVPDYATGLETTVDRFFDRLRVDAGVWRSNWSLTTHATRRLEPDEALQPEREPVDVANDVHLRIERQTLRRLSRSDAIVFTIRVHHWPLGRVADTVGSALAEELATMPDEVARYKAVSTLRPAVLEWLTA